MVREKSLINVNDRILINKTDYSKVFLSNVLIDNQKEKIIIKKVKNNPTQSFEREVDALTNLKHNNIVSLFGFDNNKKEIYFEYLNGKTLSRYCEERYKLSLDESISIFGTISKILDYIHSNSMNKLDFVHYDISDNNFMISGDSIKLIDFGTSYRVCNIPKNYYEMEVGTSEFMSPEKLKFLPEYGKEADIYAFGVIAYQLLTGIKPFLDCIGCIRNQILNYNPIPINSENPKIDEIIMSCLSKNPEDRPKSEELIKCFN